MLKRVVILVASVLLLTACTTTKVADLFETTGRVWPPEPQQARIAFVGQFSDETDLGILPTFWQKVVSMTAGQKDTRMMRPMDVAVTNDLQVILVADADARCVHKYDRARRTYRCVTTSETPQEFQPVGITIIDDQWMVASDSRRGLLYRARLDAEAFEVFFVSRELDQPTGIAWNATTKRLYVTDTGRQSVLEFDDMGNLKRVIGKRGARPGEFNFPTYLWADRDNELLVADSLNYRLQRFDEVGRFISEFGKNGDHPGDFARPKGVATDRFGHVYVIDALMHLMQIFNRDGNLLLTVGERGQGDGQFWLPNGIFVTPDNTIFVADTYNKRVQILRYVGPES